MAEEGNGESFKIGDVLIIDPDLPPNPGDFVIISPDENSELILRKYTTNSEGHLVLVAFNKNYPEKQIDANIIIYGVVVGQQKTLR
jgi:SOS-response transcriptional repressor LexA